MLYNNDIKELLGLEEVNINGIKRKEGIFEIEISKPRETCHCPQCKTRTNKVHDYRTQRVSDLDAFGLPVILILRKRRYRCPNCNKCFYESYNFLARYQRRTKRAFALILEKLREMVTYSHVAKECGVSATTVMRYFDLISYPQVKKAPEVIAIDEFKGNLGGQKFQVILTDPVNKVVIDILPCRSQWLVADYLRKMEDRDQVRFVVSDLSRSFASILEDTCPNAYHCADKYHVTRLVLWAFEAVRKRTQQNLDPSYRRYFKRSKSLLNQRYDTLSPENQQAVDVMLRASTELAAAHHLKEMYLQLKFIKEPESYRCALSNWIKLARSSTVEDFNKCANTFTHWFPSICNAQASGCTNGFTEGYNNKIKILKRISYGLRNFTRTRNRIRHIAA